MTLPVNRTQRIAFLAPHDRYQEQHQTKLEKFKADMLALHFDMEAETKAIKEALEEMRAEDTETAIEMTNAFLTLSKSIIEKFENTHERAKQKEQLQLLRDKLKDSQQELMYHEITGLDSFGEMMKSFEITYTSKKALVINTRLEFFTDIEELNRKFTEEVRKEVQALLSEFHDAPGGYQGVKLDDDLVILLQDKETLLQTVSGSSDLHVGKIAGLEDEMREQFNKRTTQTVETMKNEQREINRMRVLEIKSLQKETLKTIEDKAKSLNL